MSTNTMSYVNTSVPDAAKLLTGDDAITFSVLVNILHGTCTQTVTDLESFILCYSTSPYPVWVWCKDVTDTACVKEIAAAIRTYFPAEKDFRWNMTYTLFEALKGVDPYFEPLATSMGLLSYRMDALLPAEHSCSGTPELARAEDTDLLCKLWHDASLEMEGFDHDKAFCLDRVTGHLKDGTLHVWRNADGELVAMVGRRNTPPFGKIGPVYTLPEHRRKGYAINLVHVVSKQILHDGLTPILYTDANYAASNACYKKIGYREVSALCCVGKK